MIIATDGGEKGSKGRHEISVVPTPRELVNVEGQTSQHWYAVGSPPDSVYQGWKLYISATPNNFALMLRSVCPVLIQRGLAFKYLNSIKSLMEINAGIHGFSQIGKCLVVYLHDVNEGLIDELRAILNDIFHRGPVVPRLKRAWSGASVFYRYGSYRSSSVRIDSSDVLDDRSKPSRVDDCIEVDPFRRFHPSQREDAHNRSILERFPVTSVICKSGKGGVFNAVDSTGVAKGDLIVKLGLRHGQELIDGRDGAHFVANEHSMYRLLCKKGFGAHLARVVGFANEIEATVLVLEKLRGQNLAEWRRGGGRDPLWMRRAMELIGSVHRKGFDFGDAKLANFVKCENSLKIVDLESFQSIGCGARSENPSTFRITGAGELAPQAFDEIHFLISAIYLDDIKGKSLCRSRTIDVHQVVASFKPRDDWDIAALRELVMALGRSGWQYPQLGAGP